VLFDCHFDTFSLWISLAQLSAVSIRYVAIGQMTHIIIDHCSAVLVILSTFGISEMKKKL
jgi:hypothetical protein